MNRVVTSHQKPGEFGGPIVQIATSQRPNAPLHLVRHVFVVVLLISESTQEIEKTVARVLPLLAQGVNKCPIQLREEIVLINDHRGIIFERDKVLRVAGVVILVCATRFTFEVVAYVTQECETLLWRPEERVVQHLERSRAMFGLMRQH